MAEQRTITKALGGVEDLLYGKGTVQQERAGNVYTVTKNRTIRPVDSLEELNDLDPDLFPEACIIDGTSIDYYVYIEGAWERAIGSTDLIAFQSVEFMKAQTGLMEGDIVQTKGYYATGDGGAGSYVIVPNTEVADGGLFHDLDNGLQAKLLYTTAIDIRQFGVSASLADNTERLTALFTSAKPGLFKVLAYSNEVYSFSSDVTILSATSITLEGNCTFEGINAGIYFEGALTEVATVTAASGVHDQFMTVSNPANLSVDDLIIIWNSIQGSYSPHRDEYYDGEFQTIKAINGSVLTFYSSLLTSYAAAATNKVFRVDPVNVNIKGCKFIGGSLYSLRVRYGRDCVLMPEYVENKTDNQSAALNINKCYHTLIQGGRYFREASVNSGTDYGIGIANCQDVTIIGVDAYARRHAISTGGDNQNGAVPCRFIRIRDSHLVNSPNASVYNADFHGNTLDSYYENCDIFGCIGLAGENVWARKCRVHAYANDDAPLTYQELVGGDLGFVDCDVTMDQSNTATSVVNNAGSSLTANISKPYNIYVTDLKTETTSSIVTIVNVFENSGQENSWYIDGFDVVGAPGTYQSVVDVNVVAPGANPDKLHISNIRGFNPLAGIIAGGSAISGTEIKLPSMIGTGAEGEFEKREDGYMTCQFDFSDSQAIDVAFLGGFRTGALVWTYPENFIGNPDVQITADDGTCMGGVISAAGPNSCTFFLTTISSQTIATVSAKLKATGKYVDNS